MNIIIERASEDDAIEIIKVRNKSFYEDFLDFGECPGYNISIDEMKKKIQKFVIYKISVDGKIIGDISIDIRENYFWIGCLEIIPEFQNFGIGTEVLKFIEEKHPEAKIWGLETPAQNYRNCCFYEKMGFVKVKDTQQSEKITLRTYEKINKN
ncbi:GNAT family N-acetyltransferase [Pseudobacteroides cellulosolvens]|uniref:GCN5-related N-acetyltransferase n=1 Tax=Pseudobacteroides cellulosolvens ATCC 35603 = DSM 2933 TaxID=398512 RepID=A0A0L6JR72_9FIRM|nr:GNAT family N-acetyltransferase [Pseudobacteroides cellulosolvens]KNY28284.1 GCN5-related N-acetyltransferase [Pseudobacteroides cellulosolvens ATCC 35603 = DSM 2933]